MPVDRQTDEAAKVAVQWIRIPDSARPVSVDIAAGQKNLTVSGIFNTVFIDEISWEDAAWQ